MTGDEDAGVTGGEDAGPPIEVLESWREPAPPDLIERVRASIDRRETAAAAIDLSWRGLAAVFIGFMQMLFGLFEGVQRIDDKEGEWDDRSRSS